MKFAMEAIQCERARQSAICEIRLAHSTQRRLSAWNTNGTERVFLVGAGRPPTNDKEAVNGPRSVWASRPMIVDRNSPQPPHNFIGNRANRTKPGTVQSGLIASPRSRISSMTSVPQLGGGGVWLLHSSPSLFPFPEINYPAHFISPVRVLAKPNMEKRMGAVSLKEIAEAEIEEARRIHERLIVRLMVAPGDSKGAMYRAEQAYGLPYWCQHNLRHQRRASGEFIARLHAVWRAVLQSSVQRDVAELLAGDN